MLNDLEQILCERDEDLRGSPVKFSYIGQFLFSLAIFAPNRLTEFGNGQNTRKR